MIVKNKTSLIFSTTTTTSLSSSSLLLLANLLLGSCLCLQQDEQVKYADGRLTKLTKQQQLAADILYKNSDYLSKTVPLDGEDNDNWRFKYIDELHPNGFEYLIRDKSFEQRVADMIDLTNTNRPTDVNIFAIDSGDTQLDEQQLLLAADNENNDQMCSQHLDEILLQINEMSKLTKNQQKPSEKHVRLARVLDSFAHYEGGLFAGRDFFIGSYYQCISSNLLLNSIPTDSDDAKPVVVVDKPASLIKTRYCMAKLDLEDHLSPSLKTRHREEHEHKPKIYAGICLPSTCHTRNFMMMQHGRLNTNKARVQMIVDSQFKLPEFMFREQNLSLHSVFCLIDSDSKLNELSLAAKIFIVLIITWLLLIGAATYKLNVNPAWCENEDFFVHHFKCKQWFNVALKSLSLNESWNDFMENNRTITYNDAGNHQKRLHTNSTSSSIINLNTINPIKALACAVVIFGHSLVMTIMSSTDLIATNKQVEQDPWMFLFLMSTLVVDTIFVITGILLSYLTLIRLDKMKKAQKYTNSRTAYAKITSFIKLWLQIASARFLRLLPMYYLVFWFRKSIYFHLGSGPVWDQGLNRQTLTGACRQESWLSPLTFQAAYTQIAKQCLPHAWSVAGDLFSSIFLAPIIILFSKKPRLALILSLILIFLSNATMLQQLLTMDKTLREGFKEVRLIAITQLFHVPGLLYTAPHHRIFSFTVGLIAGYALFRYSNLNLQEAKKKKKKYVDERIKQTTHSNAYNWPSWLRGKATVGAVGLLLANFIFPPLLPILRPVILNKYPIHHPVFDFTMTLGRLMDAIAYAIILLRMMTDWKDSFWMKKCSSKFWRILVKLNYPILLIHMDVLSYDLYRSTTLGPYLGKYDIVKLFASTYLFCLAFSVVLHLTIEHPVNKLIKHLTFARMKGKTS